MKLYTFFLYLFAIPIFGQNIGIGIANPTKAKLEVFGAGGLGNTTAIFGMEEAGISLQRNKAAIGFNQYKSNPTGNGQMMANGYASSIIFDQVTGVIDWRIFSGTKDADTGSGTSIFRIANNGNIGIGKLADIYPVEPTYVLSLSKGLWVVGSTSILGSEVNSNFNKDVIQINGGLINSKIFVNDVPNGKILIGANTISTYDPAIGFNKDVALSIKGGIAFTKRDGFQPCNGVNYNPLNNSYVNVNPTCSNSIMNINNGLVDGQLLLIQAQGGKDFIINDAGNINLPNNITMGGGDILMLMWNQPVGQWEQLSYSNN